MALIPHLLYNILFSKIFKNIPYHTQESDTWINSLTVKPLAPDGSYMIHGSYGRNKRPEAKESVDNANFLFTKKLIGPLNVDRPLLIH